ncbi:hypothetical protein P20495_0170 [Pseudoalteromonas sp. BSi20495]|nr:hypothetical protein P20495_0170 [Pseudoalteromonas sp. BSi20495]
MAYIPIRINQNRAKLPSHANGPYLKTKHAAANLTSKDKQALIK